MQKCHRLYLSALQVPLGVQPRLNWPESLQRAADHGPKTSPPVSLTWHVTLQVMELGVGRRSSRRVREVGYKIDSVDSFCLFSMTLISAGRPRCSFFSRTTWPVLSWLSPAFSTFCNIISRVRRPTLICVDMYFIYECKFEKESH